MSEPADEFAGHGGSYLVNPETNKRELIERTQTVAEPAIDELAPTASESE